MSKVKKVSKTRKMKMKQQVGRHRKSKFKYSKRVKRVTNTRTKRKNGSKYKYKYFGVGGKVPLDIQILNTISTFINKCKTDGQDPYNVYESWYNSLQGDKSNYSNPGGFGFTKRVNHMLNKVKGNKGSLEVENEDDYKKLSRSINDLQQQRTAEAAAAAEAAANQDRYQGLLKLQQQQQQQQQQEPEIHERFRQQQQQRQQHVPNLYIATIRKFINETTSVNSAYDAYNKYYEQHVRRETDEKEKKEKSSKYFDPGAIGKNGNRLKEMFTKVQNAVRNEEITDENIDDYSRACEFIPVVAELMIKETLDNYSNKTPEEKAEIAKKIEDNKIKDDELKKRQRLQQEQEQNPNRFIGNY
jgi:hypothetical protein